jgi:hypothetical protein
MAFCNSCGANLPDGTKFCSKCGAAVAAPVAAVPAAPAFTPVTPGAPPPSSGSSSALKIILIIVAVLVFLFLLVGGGCFYAIHRLKNASHVQQDGDNVKVETPFGNISSSKDPEQAAKDLGIDIYPGAEVQKNGASSASFGNIRTVTAKFTSSDSVDKVCSFYKEKFPSAQTTASDTNRCTLVSNDSGNMVTIHIMGSGDGSNFTVTTVHKGQ